MVIVDKKYTCGCEGDCFCLNIITIHGINIDVNRYNGTFFGEFVGEKLEIKQTSKGFMFDYDRYPTLEDAVYNFMLKTVDNLLARANKAKELISNIK